MDTKTIDRLNEESWKLRYRDLESSKQSAGKALDGAEKIDYPRGQAAAYLNLAAGHFLRSENKEALELLSKALGYFKDHTGEEGYPSTLTYMGNIYESFGDYETALEHCQRALKAANEIGYNEGRAEALSVLGLVYSRLSDFQRALSHYQEGLHIREAMGDEEAMASSLNRIARIHTLRKHFGEALEHYHRSLKIRRNLDQKGVINWTYLGMASTYEEMEDFTNAESYYQKILASDPHEVDDRCGLQARLGLGRTLSKSGREEEAAESLNEALALANKLGAKPLQFEAHQALARYYELTGVFNLALLHHKRYRSIREEVQNEESSNRLKNQQIAFAVEKSEKEKEIYQLRNVELNAAFEEIRQKNSEIMQSINYASRIQSALLPQEENLSGIFSGHFILYLPKDVVSGDFYWSARVEGKLVFAAADCTGHGVPGALMSMLGISFLNEIVSDRGITRPGEILDVLREEVIKALKQTGGEDEQKDGMDIALCTFDPGSGLLEFAGAYNPLYLIRCDELEEIRADRMPVSYYHGISEPFSTHSMQLAKGDRFYLFSDGYADQFGGPDRKKFKYKPLKEFLLGIQQETMEKQKELLLRKFLEWKGDHPQIDDVVFLGIRI